MSAWEHVQKRKTQMRREAIASLTDEEKEILIKVLDLEWENRHLKTPDIRRTLRNYIKQVIQ